MKYPKVIYLNVKDDDGFELEDFTWSEEGINQYDIKYEIAETTERKTNG